MKFAAVLALALAVPAALPVLAQAPAPAVDASMVFDVRNGDQEGKLMLKETELAFESLTDSRHSRNWAYSDIRELSRKGRKELRVRPNKGSRYDFQFKDRGMRDNLHKLIAERILAARQGSRR